MTRLTYGMSAFEMVMVMADGAPGATRVLFDLLNKGGEIDPDAALGGLSCLLDLDTHGIYGADIQTLFNVCGSDLVKTAAVLRGLQLGIVRADAVTQAIRGGGDGFDAGKMLTAVRERLPAFGKTAPAEAAS